MSLKLWSKVSLSWHCCEVFCHSDDKHNTEGFSDMAPARSSSVRQGSWGTSFHKVLKKPRTALTWGNNDTNLEQILQCEDLSGHSWCTCALKRNSSSLSQTRWLKSLANISNFARKRDMSTLLPQESSSGPNSLLLRVGLCYILKFLPIKYTRIFPLLNKK